MHHSFIIFSCPRHTSVIYAVESVIDLILKVAGPVLKGKVADVEVKLEHEKKYSDEQQVALSQRVWTTCRSWYKDANGRNFTLYPYSMYTMWWHTRFPSMSAWTYTKVGFLSCIILMSGTEIHIPPAQAELDWQGPKRNFMMSSCSGPRCKFYLTCIYDFGGKSGLFPENDIDIRQRCEYFRN